MDRNATALLVEIAAQIVDAVQMIRMRMRVQHGVHMAHPGGDHLRAEIRAGIDDDGGAAAIRADLLDKEGRARAAVARLCRIAGTPVPVDARPPRRGCASRPGERTLGKKGVSKWR